MKKMTVLILTAVLVCGLFGCGAESAETTDPIQTTAPTQTTAPAENTVPETTSPQIPDGSVCLDQMIEGSDIEMTCEGQKIVLSEDGLTVELSTDSLLVYREGYVAAVLKDIPMVIGENVYVHEDFYKDFLCAEEAEQPSLFHGVLFFAEEILAAIDAPEASAFNQKVAAEVLLPSSMGIELPHVDMGRAFQNRLLSEYPDVLAQELAGLGYENPTGYTYTEYAILSGAQTLAQAGITADMAAGIEYDPNMTVSEYYRELALLSGSVWDGLTDAEKEFVTEQQIELDDWRYLHREFDRQYQGEYMNQPEETLRETLIGYYEFDLSYLRSMTESDSE